MLNNPKIIIGSAILVIAIFIGYASLPDLFRRYSHKNNPGYSIAILTPTSHPALEEIEAGFKETLEEVYKVPVSCFVYNANGNKTLMRAQAEEMVMGAYDLIFTIGSACSQMVAELEKKRHRAIPQVFASVADKAYAEQLIATNPFATGCYVEPNYEKQIDLLLTIKPTLKNVLLVYDPTQGIGLEKDKNKIQTYLAQRAIKLHAVEVYSAHEIQQKVAGLLSGIDSVLVLTDNTVVAGIDSLITLCNRYGVTLFASDLASGKKGAALAYGTTERQAGVESAKKAYQILLNAKNPSSIPVSAVDDFVLAINKETMGMQNSILDDEKIDFLNQKTTMQSE